MIFFILQRFNFPFQYASRIWTSCLLLLFFSWKRRQSKMGNRFRFPHIFPFLVTSCDSIEKLTFLIFFLFYLFLLKLGKDRWSKKRVIDRVFLFGSKNLSSFQPVVYELETITSVDLLKQTTFPNSFLCFHCLKGHVVCFQQR